MWLLVNIVYENIRSRKFHVSHEEEAADAFS